MKIEKNKLVNRAQVLNKDIQLGIIVYSVAAQSLEKRNAGKITEEEAVFKDCKEYIRSVKEFCDENGWSVCILLSCSSLK